MTEQKTSGKALLFIFITLFIDVMGIGIIIPVLPKLIMSMEHCSIEEATVIGGWMMFIYSFMQFFFSPLLGALSDRFGRRPVLLISLLGFGIDYLFLGFAGSISLLFIGRLIAGITGASFTVAGAYIADISPPEKRAQNFAFRRARTVFRCSRTFIGKLAVRILHSSGIIEARKQKSFPMETC
jgi:DHA1 family tetracycline resistance protein-like MFS transporter